MVMMAHLIGEMEKDNVGEPAKHQLLHLVWHLHTDAISHIKHFNNTSKVRYIWSLRIKAATINFGEQKW